MSGCFENSELKPLVQALRELQSSGDIKLAILYGSFAYDSQHCRSDIGVDLLVRHRIEMIHQYIKINWQNIITVKQKMDAMRNFTATLEKLK